MKPVALDVVIFGGGVAGLWLLDELRRRGYSAVLLEAAELGRGQTIASQGILHGGLKYTLDGLLSASADATREMPAIWRACLRGERQPDLRQTRVRAEFCHLWRTGSLRSQLGMIGARVGLQVRPEKLPADEWPAALRGCPGEVFRLNEQVIDPGSLLQALAERNAGRVLSLGKSWRISCRSAGEVDAIELAGVEFQPRAVVFAAGEGNASLRERAGLSPDTMQRRPLHMALVRGDLPALNGHCADGSATRVTITTDHDGQGRTIWQVGGQVAEDGVGMSERELIRHVRDELHAAVPAVDFSGAEWSTYRVDRAEPATPGGKRPRGAFANREGNVITAWPTKLVLAPALADEVIVQLGRPDPRPSSQLDRSFVSWPRPMVAQPPWKQAREWQIFG